MTIVTFKYGLNIPFFMDQKGLRTILKQSSQNESVNLRDLNRRNHKELSMFKLFKKVYLLEKAYYSFNGDTNKIMIPDIVSMLPNYIALFEELISANDFYISFNHSKKTIPKKNLISNYNVATMNDINNMAFGKTIALLYDLKNEEGLFNLIRNNPKFEDIVRRKYDGEKKDPFIKFDKTYSRSKHKVIAEELLDGISEYLTEIGKPVPSGEDLDFFKEFHSSQIFSAMSSIIPERKLSHWNTDEFRFLVGGNNYIDKYLLELSGSDETQQPATEDGQKALSLLSHLVQYVTPYKTSFNSYTLNIKRNENPSQLIKVTSDQNKEVDISNLIND